MRFLLCTLSFCCFLVPVSAQGATLDASQRSIENLRKKVEAAKLKIEKARQLYLDTVNKAVADTIVTLKERIGRSSTSHEAKAAFYRTILRIDPTDDKARKFFLLYGNLETVMADLGPPIVKRDRFGLLGLPTPGSTVVIPSDAGVHATVDKDQIVARLFLVADDFVVDIWVNGKVLPDSQRKMLREIHGATGERVDTKLEKGDWIIFNVVNNRMRWGGCSYFGVHAVNGANETLFSSLPNGKWYACDDPSKVKEFIARRDAGLDSPATSPARAWGGAGGVWKGMLKREFPGKPVWGKRRNTWIKYVVR